jgi:hypothetical protein
MPIKVPRYGNRQVLTGPAEFRRENVQTNVEQFGGGNVAESLASGVKSLVSTVAEIEESEKKRADDIRVMEARKQAAQLQSDYQTQIDMAKGQNSFQLQDTVVPEFQQRLNEIESSLANDEQKMKFRADSNQRFVSVYGAANKKMGAEVMAFQDQAIDGFVQAEEELALKNFEDFKVLDSHVANQVESIKRKGDLQGLPAYIKKNAWVQVQSSTYSKVIKKIADAGDDIKAKEYYQQYHGKLTEADKSDLKKLLDESSKVGESQRIADQIMLKYGDNPVIAMEKARASSKDELRDEVTRRVKSRIAENRQIKNESRLLAFDELMAAREGGASYDDLPMSKKMLLTTKQRQTLQAGHAEVSDPNVKYDLFLKMTSGPTKKEFLRTDLRQYIPKLTASDFQSYMKMQNDLKQKGSSKDFDGIQTKGQILKLGMQKAGIKIDKDSSEEMLDKAVAFNSEVDRLVAQRQDAMGRKVTNEELRDITNNLAVQVVTDPGYLFGLIGQKQKRLYELTSKDKAQISVKDLPQAVKDEISMVLRQRKLPVTDDIILKMYTNRLERIRNR